MEPAVETSGRDNHKQKTISNDFRLREHICSPALRYLKSSINDPAPSLTSTHGIV